MLPRKKLPAPQLFVPDIDCVHGVLINSNSMHRARKWAFEAERAAQEATTTSPGSVKTVFLQNSLRDGLKEQLHEQMG